MARLSDVGEKEMVSTITSLLHTSARLGPGDDAAAVEMGDRFLVASTDLLWEGTHFHPRMSWWQRGWMAAAVNLSDMAAMGAQPIGILLAFGMPKDLEDSKVMEMVQGAADCCDRFGTDYLGGDTKECPELVIVGTSLGLVPKDGLLTRKGARPGDLLAMTGSAGLASAGLLALDRGIESRTAIRALFEPLPRIKEGTLLSSSGVVTSCTDTSDGLSTSLHELSQSSRAAFELDLEAVPVDPETRRVMDEGKGDLNRAVLHGGGDYQLLFTIPPEGWDRLHGMLGDEVKVIGRCIEGTSNILKEGASNSFLRPMGYEHFRH
jgi:thiamine-monophosphate kinase